jgi:ribosomal protein RSM22 (predicted rRNA methylase)
VESLYASGQISREEWRESVFAQAGIEEGGGGEDGSSDGLGDVEGRVRRVRQWYGLEVVPEDLLGAEERVVHERLFGGMRTLHMAEMEEQDGTGDIVVLREDGREIELEEEDDELEMEMEMEHAARQKPKRPRVSGDERLANDIRRSMAESESSEGFNEGESVEDEFRRTHPLTLANRFPAPVEIPRATFIEPISLLIASRTDHLPDAAHRIFGGPGLPYSTSTPARGKLMQQKAIALNAAQTDMAEMDGDAFLSTLMPGIYASVASVLTETRKRLGTSWAEDLVRKAEAGELRILDAGGAGAGVVAVRDMLRAEWERMHDTDMDGLDSPMALAEADGKVGGEHLSPPLGSATVLTASDVLRRRAAKLLENTSFIPRLPDYNHAEEVKLKGKFDIIVAPHTLWPLREDNIRKPHVQNLWHLLNSDGGVLILLEKGVARGFEMIAGAREMLLENHISSPGSTERSTTIEEPGTTEYADLMMQPKETGMIIAPCTNHAGCPMYTQKGVVKGRRTICAFEQRYHRPAFLQKIFGSKAKNHEDVEFSYLAVMRGKDLRSPETLPRPIVQGEQATMDAFKGFEDADAVPNGLELPRAVLQPMKRTGHVIMDLCTPAGTLERWTVPRSFSKTAYRDARKSSWGDIWALGAKTRVVRGELKARNNPKVEAQKQWDLEARLVPMKGLNKRSGGYGVKPVAAGGAGADEFGRVVDIILA